jgi:broad specificity phosphatase PhoE
MLQPLSDLGIEQAKALGRTSRIRDTSFWRMYASDLKRAEHTAHLILNSAGKSPETLVIDPRLRETSKGARQGFPKTMSEDEAMEERRKRKDTEPLPNLETEDAAWSRAIDWLNDVVKDAVLTARLESSLASDQQQSIPPCYTVLAVAHAGIYRIFLRRLLGEDRLFAHPDASFDPADSRFAIPNTSLTILDVTPQLQENGEAVPIDEAFEHIDIVQLTGTGHLLEEAPLVVQEENTTTL